jgi:hypothetical protein
VKFSLIREELQYFRSVRKRQILDFTKFNPGLYYVRGRNETTRQRDSNGSGKSTMLAEGPIWILTGCTSRAKRPGDSIENWYFEKQPTEGLLEFLIDGDRQVLERTRNPNDLRLNGQKVEQRDIDQMLPLTDAALRRSILIDQRVDDPRGFLSLGPEAQSRIFSETLDLDRYVRAAERASKFLSEQEKIAQKLETAVATAAASLAEVKVEYDEAVESEKGFEAQMKSLLRDASEKKRLGAVRAREERERLDSARDALSALGSDEARRQRILNDSKTELRKMRGNQSVAESRLAALRNETLRLEVQVSKYKDAGGICPECGQRVEDNHIAAKLNTAKFDLTRNKQAFVEAADNLEAIKAEIAKLETSIAKEESKLVKWTELQGKVALAAAKSLEADKDLHNIEDEIEELKTRKNPFVIQCDRLEERMKALRTELRTSKANLGDAQRKVDIYKFWHRGFREIRLEQIDTTLIELEMATNRQAEALGLENWEIGFATEREKRTGGVSLGFSVFLYPPNVDKPMSWESYSGGESQRWELAITFGLADVLLTRAGIEPDFEVLDEPSTHLSPEAVDDLLGCLRDRAYEMNRRIFVVDHSSFDSGAFDGVIDIVKDNTGTHLIGDYASKPKRERVRL